MPIDTNVLLKDARATPSDSTATLHRSGNPWTCTMLTPLSKSSTPTCARNAVFAFLLTDDAKKIIKRSALRLADCPENQIRLDQNNLRLDKAAGVTLKRKVNFRAAGRDPSLAEGFIMKTLEPDLEKANDVPSPEKEDDDDSITAVESVPIPIDDVPELPEMSWRGLPPVLLQPHATFAQDIQSIANCIAGS